MTFIIIITIIIAYTPRWAACNEFLNANAKARKRGRSKYEVHEWKKYTTSYM